VIAADAGATTALRFGFTPDLVLGDFDSIDPATLTRVRAEHVRIETHPRDKNATDGQLAIERALESSPDELFLVGYLGGPRLDQALANVLLLAALEVPAVLLDAQNECRLLRDASTLAWTAEPDEVVSLIPLTPVVEEVRTVGLRWPLENERLLLGDTRGVSNEPATERVEVSIDAGRLLVTRHFPRL
jgi:thiamine pyrophosphokinase